MYTLKLSIAEWALAISASSLAISLGSLFWSVWSKFNSAKAAIKVSLTVCHAIGRDGKSPNSAMTINLRATNLGPGGATVVHAIGRKGWLSYIRERGTHVIHPFPNPNGAGEMPLPAKLAQSETCDLHFPLSKHWFIQGYKRFGFRDSYEKDHWCSRQAAKSLESFLMMHGDIPDRFSR